MGADKHLLWAFSVTLLAFGLGVLIGRTETERACRLGRVTLGVVTDNGILKPALAHQSEVA